MVWGRPAFCIGRIGHVGARLAGEGVLKSAFAGKPQCQSVKTRNPVGAELARESGISGDINVDCTAAFAGKPAPTELRLTDWHCGKPGSYEKRLLLNQLINQHRVGIDQASIARSVPDQMELAALVVQVDAHLAVGQGAVSLWQDQIH